MSDMSGIIPEEEDEMYDDVGNAGGIDEPDEIYEELPGLTTFSALCVHLFERF